MPEILDSLGPISRNDTNEKIEREKEEERRREREAENERGVERERDRERERIAKLKKKQLILGKLGSYGMVACYTCFSSLLNTQT